MTRRQALWLPWQALALTCQARAQQKCGMASRGVKPAPRGKPSGLPFHAQFTNVAQSAGLRSPVIYGPPNHADYLLEAMGCGAAFLDYDNDGWLDIVLLTGRRFHSTPDGAVIRLYRNNRDGTFTDVTEKSGLAAVSGPPASQSATTITTGSTTCSSPAGARTSCSATTATARSPM